MDFLKFFQNSTNTLIFQSKLIESGLTLKEATTVCWILTFIANKNTSLPDGLSSREVYVSESLGKIPTNKSRTSTVLKNTKIGDTKLFTKARDAVLKQHSPAMSVQIELVADYVFYEFTIRNKQSVGVNPVKFIEVFGELISTIHNELNTIKPPVEKTTFSMEGRGVFDASTPEAAYNSLKLIQRSGDNLNELVYEGDKILLDLENDTELKQALLFLRFYMNHGLGKYQLFKHFKSKFSFASSFRTIIGSSMEYYTKLSKNTKLYNSQSKGVNSIVNMMANHIIGEAKFIKGFYVKPEFTANFKNIFHKEVHSYIVELLLNGKWYTVNIPSQRDLQLMAERHDFAGKEVAVDYVICEYLKKNK